MATIGQAVTLADIQSRLGADHKIAQIIEILKQKNQVLEDMKWMECNDGSGHKTTVRTGLPEATWRLLNYGVQPSKSTTTQIRDTTGMLEAYAEVDKALVDLNSNKEQFLLSENKAFIEALNRQVAETLFYGDTSRTPERFLGLHARYCDAQTAENKGQILNGGGTGSANTSVWFVGWGDTAVHGLYPKGMDAGLKFSNLGETTKTLADGSMLQVIRTHYTWHCGLTARDWRYVIRIANLDVAKLASGTGAADLVKLLVEAEEMIPDETAKWVIYCNRQVRTALRWQILAKTNVNLTFDNVGGKRVMAFDEIPIKRCDQLLNTESAISFA